MHPLSNHFFQYSPLHLLPPQSDPSYSHPQLPRSTHESFSIISPSREKPAFLLVSSLLSRNPWPSCFYYWLPLSMEDKVIWIVKERDCSYLYEKEFKKTGNLMWHQSIETEPKLMKTNSIKYLKLFKDLLFYYCINKTKHVRDSRGRGGKEKQNFISTSL